MIRGWAHDVLLSFVHHRIFIDQTLLKEIPVFCSSLVMTEFYWHKMVAVLCATGNNSVVAKHSSARPQNVTVFIAEYQQKHIHFYGLSFHNTFPLSFVFPECVLYLSPENFYPSSTLTISYQFLMTCTLHVKVRTFFFI